MTSPANDVVADGVLPRGHRCVEIVGDDRPLAEELQRVPVEDPFLPDPALAGVRDRDAVPAQGVHRVIDDRHARDPGGRLVEGGGEIRRDERDAQEVTDGRERLLLPVLPGAPRLAVDRQQQ